METKVNLYIIRHGETYLNRYKKMQGWADSPLTEEGRVIAIEAGKKLASVLFDQVYSSDSGRTVETAEVILRENEHNQNPVINKKKAFRELFFGSFEGEYSDVVWRAITTEFGYETVNELFNNHRLEEVMNAIKKADPFHHAESYQELWQRVEKGLNEIISSCQKEEENILLVTHGVTIRTMINQFSDEFGPETEIKNSSVSILEYSRNVFKVVSFNQ